MCIVQHPISHCPDSGPCVTFRPDVQTSTALIQRALHVTLGPDGAHIFSGLPHQSATARHYGWRWLSLSTAAVNYAKDNKKLFTGHRQPTPEQHWRKRTNILRLQYGGYGVRRYLTSPNIPGRYGSADSARHILQKPTSAPCRALDVRLKTWFNIVVCTRHSQEKAQVYGLWIFFGDNIMIPDTFSPGSEWTLVAGMLRTHFILLRKSIWIYS